MTAIRRVLCPVDLSDCSRRALEHAVSIAARWEAHLTVLHVHQVSTAVELGAPFTPTVPTEARPEALRQTVCAFARSVAPDAPISIRITDDVDVRRAIVEEVETDNADLLVIGRHAAGTVDRFLLGSTSAALVRQTQCPVLVVPAHADPPSEGQFRRVLCGLDFSAPSLRAYRYALHLAHPDGEVRLLHAIEMPPELRERQIVAAFDVEAVRTATEKATRQRLEALFPGTDAPAVRTVVQVVEGRAHRQIVATARQEGADLIVLGTRGRGAVGRLVFGSNTHAVLENAPCAVLTVDAE